MGMHDVDQTTPPQGPGVRVVDPPIHDWWDELFPYLAHKKPPGADTMLYLIAYDIADPRRLARVADICEDYGNRVQYSLFECWLDDDGMEVIWRRLSEVIDTQEDRLVAYPIDAGSARKRRKAGKTMVLTERLTTLIV